MVYGSKRHAKKPYLRTWNLISCLPILLKTGSLPELEVLRFEEFYILTQISEAHYLHKFDEV